MLGFILAALIVTAVANRNVPVQRVCTGCDATIHENYKLQTYGKVLDSCADTIEQCYDLCLKDSACSAISYRSDLKTCILSYCAFIVLTPDCAYSSKVRGNPVVAGGVLPAATHHFVLTDQCGTTSYGLSNMGISTFGLKFDVKINKPRFGNALGFPGDCKNGTFLYARTNPDPSIRAYSAIDSSFSIAFLVRLEELINIICFTELRSFGSQSIHYWMWPDTTKIHYNIVDLKSEVLPYSFVVKKWHHFVVTYDASTALQRIFIDENLIMESVIPWANRRLIEMLSIGGNFHSAYGLFKGSIYCYSLFNRALTMPQIWAHNRACIDGHLLFLEKPGSDNCCGKC